MLYISESVLVLIDVQEKLFRVMHEQDKLLKKLLVLLRAALLLEMPVIWMEQTPDKMGYTVREIKGLLAERFRPMRKDSFGCCDEPAFMRALSELGKKQVLLAGIEAHVCVYQTACALQGKGYDVQVVADAVSSRHESDMKIGFERIKACGATLTSTETCLFELLGTAAHPAFREILKLVK